MNIAIVILNWNGRSLLEQFLPMVIAFSEGADIYMADNASTDDSIAYCQDNFPEVKIIRNTTNGGYAKGYNDALKQVSADLYVLLNSDVAVTEGWLNPIIKAFETNTNLVAAQPKIKDLKDPSRFEYAGASGGFIDSLGYPFCRGRILDVCEEDKGQYDNTIEVQWASGACLFVRSEVFWEVKGLDEDFFAHQEEIDLCWRIKNLGYSIKVIPSSEVFHLGGATLSKASPKKTFYNFRNTLFSIVKNISGPKYLFIILVRLFLDGLAGAKFLLEGKPKHVLAILKAHLSFYKHIPKSLKKRRAIKKNTQYAQLSSIVFHYYIKGIKSFEKLPVVKIKKR